jgi:hypothetical protein
MAAPVTRVVVHRRSSSHWSLRCPRLYPNHAIRSVGWYEQQGRAITGSDRELKPVLGVVRPQQWWQGTATNPAAPGTTLGLRRSLAPLGSLPTSITKVEGASNRKSPTTPTTSPFWRPSPRSFFSFFFFSFLFFSLLNFYSMFQIRLNSTLAYNIYIYCYYYYYYWVHKQINPTWCIIYFRCH